MSWATCYSGSNNIHFNTPPLMSDERLYTSFDPSCSLNTNLRKKLNIKTNYEYRQWLIHNGNKVRDENYKLAKNENSECIEAAKNFKTNDKFLFQSCLDNSRPFGYEESDLKNMYLTFLA